MTPEELQRGEAVTKLCADVLQARGAVDRMHPMFAVDLIKALVDAGFSEAEVTGCILTGVKCEVLRTVRGIDEKSTGVYYDPAHMIARLERQTSGPN
jgi:hypothetical protein